MLQALWQTIPSSHKLHFYNKDRTYCSRRLESFEKVLQRLCPATDQQRFQTKYDFLSFIMQVYLNMIDRTAIEFSHI